MVAYSVLGIPGVVGMAGSSAYRWLASGKVLSGLFGGTFPVMLAYIADLSVLAPPTVEVAEAALLRSRTTAAAAMLFTIPIALAPIGGAVATFGLELPFFVSSAVALAGLVIALCFMEE